MVQKEYRRIGLSIAVGVIYAASMYLNAYVVLGYTLSGNALWWTVGIAYQLIGMFVLAASSTYLLLRLGLLLPLLVTALFTALSVGDHFVAGLEDFTPLYLGIWFVFAGFVAAGAALEYGLRAGLSLYPPEPLA